MGKSLSCYLPPGIFRLRIIASRGKVLKTRGQGRGLQGGPYLWVVSRADEVMVCRGLPEGSVPRAFRRPVGDVPMGGFKGVMGHHLQGKETSLSSGLE